MKLSKAVFITILALVSVAGLSGFFIGAALKFSLLDVFLSLTPTAPMLSETNILVLGLDSGADIHRSDTIMVLHINPEKKTAGVVSIPRDTLVTIPGRGLDKVNHAFAYGGADLSRKTIEDFLGISIPYYILVDLNGITRLIDDIGGVDVDVEKRMYYVDYAQDLHIDLQPGWQKLNGQQAMGYLRFRHTDNDFARIGRQQNFIHQVAAQMMTRENLIRSPQMFLSLLNCVDSNLNSREILGLSLSMRGALETGQFSMTMVTGTDLMIDGIYYYRPDEINLQRIVEQYLHGRRMASSG
ncbi:MAG TPA: LCP family protein [Candidatus Sulfotelmatobacter sp.]|nr:LCP family protein [Candidatus Sulfotelmatobacter sp.]